MKLWTLVGAAVASQSQSLNFRILIISKLAFHREGVGKIERVKKFLAELIRRPCPKKNFSPGLISNL